MFLTLLYFLPSAVTLIWMVSFLFKEKNHRQTLYTVQLAFETFYLATTAVYLLPETDYPLLVRMDAFCVPACFIVFTLHICYLWLLITDRKLSGAHILLFIPALVIGSMVNLMYYIVGFDDAARLVESFDRLGMLAGEFAGEMYSLYVFLDVTLCDIMGGVYAFAIIGLGVNVLVKDGYRPGDLCRFLFRGRAVNASVPKVMLEFLFVLAFLPYAILGRKFLFHHVTPAVIMMVVVAVGKYLLSHLEFNSDACGEAQPDPVKVSEASRDDEEAGVTAAAAGRADMLAQKFRQAMEEGMFRDNDLSLVTVAEYLGVSRTTLSNMLGTHFGMPFRDIVNRYRIDAAKAYYLEHPGATQAEVAFECGFKDDSALNRKFKELEGVTPLVWLGRQASSRDEGQAPSE